MFTTSDAADLIGVRYETIRNWLKNLKDDEVKATLHPPERKLSAGDVPPALAGMIGSITNAWRWSRHKCVAPSGTRW